MPTEISGLLRLCDSVLRNLQTPSVPLHLALQEQPDAEGGKLIYERWKELAEIAIQKAADCKVQYEEYAAELIRVEDQKNDCYARGDRLRDEIARAEAAKKGLDIQIESVNVRINELERKMSEQEYSYRKLERDKKIYDILIWIPGINLISEIVAAITRVREEYEATKRDRDDRRRELNSLREERAACAATLNSLTEELSENARRTDGLEQKREVCQRRRDEAAREMLQWKDREQYFLRLSGEMKHLMEMGADEEAFRKLLADNPPPFELTV